jgi:hypothetical protein
MYFGYVYGRFEIGIGGKGNVVKVTWLKVKAIFFSPVRNKAINQGPIWTRPSMTLTVRFISKSFPPFIFPLEIKTRKKILG